MSAQSNKQAALNLAAKGIRVFPCASSKVPMVKDWENAATASVLQIEATWNESALPAIPVGALGLVVLDLDRKPNAPDGVAAFLDLCARLGIDLSRTFAVKSPSGVHLYFRTETLYGNSRGMLPEGVDVRGVGGYVIAPGATLPDGRSYQHLAGDWNAIEPLPDALANLLIPKHAAPASERSEMILESPATERERAYARAALADAVAHLSAMREGQGRNPVPLEWKSVSSYLTDESNPQSKVFRHITIGTKASGSIGQPSKSEPAKPVPPIVNFGLR